MKVEEVRGNDSNNVDHLDPSKFGKNQELYLRINAYNNSDVEKEEFQKLYDHCRNSYIEAVSQIKQRFLFTDPVFKLIEVVDPEYAQSFKTKTLIPIWNRHPALKAVVKCEEVDQEWRAHSLRRAV
jgi:hypothetical protein